MWLLGFAPNFTPKTDSFKTVPPRVIEVTEDALFGTTIFLQYCTYSSHSQKGHTTH